jgi:putative component of toxin-antitoxin plasmid stabilization module
MQLVYVRIKIVIAAPDSQLVGVRHSRSGRAHVKKLRESTKRRKLVRRVNACIVVYAGGVRRVGEGTVARKGC